uniref:Uncharacterized protein n=1 Tax=mine drainage metagenome TaxID=410659 RepID=E6Q8I6_9ZZZZ
MNSREELSTKSRTCPTCGADLPGFNNVGNSLPNNQNIRGGQGNRGRGVGGGGERGAGGGGGGGGRGMGGAGRGLGGGRLAERVSRSGRQRLRLSRPHCAPQGAPRADPLHRCSASSGRAER